MTHVLKKHKFLLCLISVYLLIQILSLRQIDILSSYIIQIIMFIGINIVMTVSLGMVNGFTGQFSIGHGGFMAVGAYTSIFFTTIIFQLLGMEPIGRTIGGYAIFFLSVLIGGCLAGVAGLLIGLPTLHLKGDYLAIVTMAFGEVIRTIIRVSDPLGGPRGVSGVPAMTNFPIIFIWTVVSVWLMRNFLWSTYGRASRAIRDSEIAAEMIGINTTKQKMIVFTISAMFAGFSGGFYAHILQFVHPDSFTFMKSLEYLIYLYIGGANSISGAMTGAIIFTIVPELFREFQNWRMVLYSLILIIIMLFRPNGIMGEREFRFIKRR
ncbi:TPA: branched-chain amino acid ABC transporter permease [Candidatus Poribacteria bacterium]|nr:branched-chain amino acid ABC transporter permease [Candidatus Poribacteria bacterium]